MDTPILKNPGLTGSPGFALGGCSSSVLIFLLALLLSNPLYAGGSFRIVSQNMNRFFDDVDNGKNEKVISNSLFDRRVEATGATIIDQFRLPDILALQEIENFNVLSKISEAVRVRSGLHYQVVMLEGNDISAINTGYLISQQFNIKLDKQLFKNTALKLDASPLFSRPPLYLEACFESNCLTLLNLHLRSMRGIRSSTRGKRVRLKRLEQASVIARWIDRFQKQNPNKSLLVLGDFNGLTPSDRYVDVVGTILGRPDNAKTEKQAVDWIKQDLIDLTREILPARRYSYIYRKNKQILDYMLVNSRFKPSLKSIKFGPIDYDFSDHAALIADFEW